MPNQPIRARCCKPSGFTLIEVMIVVAIVAVLARIALPAFFDSIRKARRSDAVTVLAQVQQAQERYRANQTTFGTHYIVSSGNLTGVGASTDTGAATSLTTSSGYYTLSQMTNVSGTRYTVQAVAQGGQANDTNCKYLQLDMNAGNVTYASGSTSSVGNATGPNNLCWRR
jgi:type IV pilus assembly protein PilE